LQFTTYGLSAVKDRGMIYLSAEYTDNFVDNETNQQFGCLLKGAGLTTRPVIKKLDAIQLDEAICPCNQFICTDLNIFEDFTMSVEDKAQDDVTTARFAELEKKLAQSQAANDLKLSQVADSIEKLVGVMTKTPAEEVKPSQTGIDAKQLSELMQQEVAKQFAEIEKERQLAAQKERELVESAVKLFEETVRAEGKSLSEPALVEILKFKSEIDASLGAKAIKLLAQEKVNAAKQIEINRQLASRGYYRPGVAGTVHIEVDESNSIKWLMDETKLRMRFFSKSKPLAADMAENAKLLTEEASRLYGESHLRQLHQEASMLKRLDEQDTYKKSQVFQLADSGSIAIPAFVQRTVTEETLAKLNGLAFVNVDTAPLTHVIEQRRSRRKDRKQSLERMRVFEGHGIPKTDIAMDSFSMYPMKMANSYSITGEAQKISKSGLLDFDALAKVTRECVREQEEAIDAAIFNEVVNSCYAAATATVTNESIAGVDGVNNTFVTATFPVVKPVKTFDMKGNPIGVTEFPITITLDGVTLNEYIEPDEGEVLPAGYYWKILSHALGKFVIVDNTGVIFKPASGKSLKASYSRSLNAAKFDAKFNIAEIKSKEHFSELLAKFSTVKKALADRLVTTDFSLMKEGLKDIYERAEDFAASFQRNGTELDVWGSLGKIKSVPIYSTESRYAILDEYVTVMGVKGNSEFKLISPWEMTDPKELMDSKGRFINTLGGYGTSHIAVGTPNWDRHKNAALIVFNSDTRKPSVTIESDSGAYDISNL